jgi:hypothetical protein
VALNLPLTSVPAAGGFSPGVRGSFTSKNIFTNVHTHPFALSVTQTKKLIKKFNLKISLFVG